jgi:hypothetical protein
MAATKVSFTWFGVRKSLSPAQKERAADSFAAEAGFLAAKKLLDTRHAAYQAVTTVRGQALHYWRSLTLPYPEAGVRLIRQSDIAGFDRQMTVFREDLAAAVDQLDRQFAELKVQARQRLGDLYNANDYPVLPATNSLCSGEFQPSSRPTICGNSILNSTNRNASGCRAGSRKPSNWPSKRSSTNWPGSSAI